MVNRQPATRVIDGIDYYSIEIILTVLIKNCDREDVVTICERALTNEASGLDLRNSYLLPIRVGLQDWYAGTTLSLMIKTLLSRALDDSIVGAIYSYEKLTLQTLVAFDHNHTLKSALR